MVLAPIYCDKCERRTTPAERITNLNGMAVGECCSGGAAAVSTGTTAWHRQLAGQRLWPSMHGVIHNLLKEHLKWRVFEPGGNFGLTKPPLDNAESWIYWNQLHIPNAVIVQINPTTMHWGLQKRQLNSQPNWDIQGVQDFTPLLDYMFTVLKYEP